MSDIEFGTEKATKLLSFLGELGGPDKIADFFQEQGIKGQKQAASHCPVHNYLEAELGDDVATLSLITGVGGTFIDEYGSFNLTTQVAAVKHPPEVAAFIKKFDRDYYPNLEA
jgi:hypothetical protein